MDAQLLLDVSGEEESGTGVSVQAVRHDKDQRTPTSPRETPAGDTQPHFLSGSLLHCGHVHRIVLLGLT